VPIGDLVACAQGIALAALRFCGTTNSLWQRARPDFWPASPGPMSTGRRSPRPPVGRSRRSPIDGARGCRRAIAGVSRHAVVVPVQGCSARVSRIAIARERARTIIVVCYGSGGG